MKLHMYILCFVDVRILEASNMSNGSMLMVAITSCHMILYGHTYVNRILLSLNKFQ